MRSSSYIILLFYIYVVFVTSFGYCASNKWDTEKLYIICDSYAAFELKLAFWKKTTVLYLGKKRGGGGVRLRTILNLLTGVCQLRQCVNHTVTEKIEARR